MKIELDYVDSMMNFRGLWDAPSICGLKIARFEDRHVVVVTELWDKNPGTSVTNFCPQLAQLICDEHSLDPKKLIFIEHTPQTGSHLEIYEETFHLVQFSHGPDGFSDPKWHAVSREEVDQLLKNPSTVTLDRLR